MGMQEDDYEDDYWEVPDNLDVSTFDFSWRPSIYEPPYIHQFGTQWGRTGGPRLVVYGATGIKYQDGQRAAAIPDISRWEVPPNLDTSKFDFSWHPEATEKPFIYQFGTQHQKTGGPRYIEPGARRIKYVDIQRAIHREDMSKWTIQDDILDIEFDFSWHPDSTELPYTYVFGNQYKGSEDSFSVIYKDVPGAPIKFMQEPRAKITYRPLDIIFVSAGELGEEDRYRRLCQLSGREVKWVRGIVGRENALRKAAEISSTQHFILFPGKLWADSEFDFNYQPPRSVDPKHYIFYALNPLNGLEYGHQAAVCYHRQLVLDTINYGLDFTMSKPHDIVPVNSGVAQYNSDILMTWRTAFREVIKLRAAGDPESIERLERWRTYARGEFSEWSLIGAEDGVNYYDRVDGDHEKLMLTFEWGWLKDYFQEHHPGIV
jgi:hypothetical protein